MTSYIGYNNILETGTVTVTSEAVGYEKENAYDWLPYDHWRPLSPGTVYITVDMGANAVVDYWAIAFHDLHDNSGSIKPQYSSNGSSWSDLTAVYTPSNGNVTFKLATQRNVRYYRFEISSPSVVSSIGMLSLGQVLALPSYVPLGFIPPELARKKEILNNFDDKSNFTGSSIVGEGYEFEIAQKIVTAAWVDSNWEDLVDHVEAKPFFYLWDHENRPNAAAFCRATPPISYPQWNNPGLLDFTIKGEALIKSGL